MEAQGQEQSQKPSKALLSPHLLKLAVPLPPSLQIRVAMKLPQLLKEPGEQQQGLEL